MRLRLSLIDSRPDSVPRPLELLVDCAPGVDLRRPPARAPAGSCAMHGDEDSSPDDVAFEVDGRPLADDVPLGAPPLLRGAVVVAAPRHRSRMPSGSVGLADLRRRGRPGCGSHRSPSVAATTSSVVRPRARCGSMTRASHGRTASSRWATATSPSATSTRPTRRASTVSTFLPVGRRSRPAPSSRVGSTTLLLRQRSMTPVRHGTRDGRVLVHVRPRFVRADPGVEIHTPEEPRRPDGHRLPLLASLAPLVLSGALALAMRSPVMLLFALMSPVILLGQWWSDRRHGRLSHRRHAEAARRQPRGRREPDERRPRGRDPSAARRASRPLPCPRARRATRSTPLGAALR